MHPILEEVQRRNKGFKAPGVVKEITQDHINQYTAKKAKKEKAFIPKFQKNKVEMVKLIKNMIFCNKSDEHV